MAESEHETEQRKSKQKNDFNHPRHTKILTLNDSHVQTEVAQEKKLHTDYETVLCKLCCTPTLQTETLLTSFTTYTQNS